MTREELDAQIAALGDTDYVVRGTACGGEIRAFATTTKRTRDHNFASGNYQEDHVRWRD